MSQDRTGGIPTDLVDKLLELWKLDRKRGPKILPGELEDHDIATACRLQMTRKIMRPMPGKKTKQLIGWRFTPAGNAFLACYSSVPGLASRIEELEAQTTKLEDEVLSSAVSPIETAQIQLSNAVEQHLTPNLLSFLVTSSTDPNLRTRLRSVLAHQLQLHRIRKEEQAKEG